MPAPLLRLTGTALDGLHREIDKVKRTSKSVRVDRDALAALLMDYGAMLDVVLQVYPDIANKLTPLKGRPS